MSTWPKTGEQLKEEGYVSSGRGDCKGCGAAMVWATTPAGKAMPLTRTQDGKWHPHWTDCPQRDQFKRKREKQ